MGAKGVGRRLACTQEQDLFFTVEGRRVERRLSGLEAQNRFKVGCWKTGLLNITSRLSQRYFFRLMA